MKEKTIKEKTIKEINNDNEKIIIKNEIMKYIEQIQNLSILKSVLVYAEGAYKARK